MHLVTLLSAIIALCLTQSAVGLPHPRVQNQETESESRGRDVRSLDVAGALGAGALGTFLRTVGTSLLNRNFHKRIAEEIKDLRKQLRKSQEAVRLQSLSLKEREHEVQVAADKDKIRGILEEFPDLKNCIFFNLEKEKYFPNSRYWADDDWDSVSWFEWNLAAKRCQDVDGWSKEALYKIREGYFFKDSNKHLLPPESGTMQSSVIDHLEKASQIGKTIFSYFKSSQGKPYTGQGAMIPRRVFLHR